MKPRALIGTLLALAATTAACADEPANQPSSAAAGIRAHRLFTHCGIEWTHYEGRYWKTDPRNDGMGNPPAGWGNPFVEGTIERVSENEAIFRAAGRELRFRPASPRETPPPCD